MRMVPGGGIIRHATLTGEVGRKVHREGEDLLSIKLELLSLKRDLRPQISTLQQQKACGSDREEAV
jgi:hypothetical protein